MCKTKIPVPVCRILSLFMFMVFVIFIPQAQSESAYGSNTPLKNIVDYGETEPSQLKIIKLAGDPVLEYKSGLLKKMESRTGILGFFVNLYDKLTFGYKLNSYRNKLKEDHKKFGAYKVKDELFDVFNGLIVNITEEEAARIRTSPEVVSVLNDTYGKVLFMDVIPTIEAYKVWEVADISGTGTGITGEGVTVGIIDSGIDYTHEDFGSCTKEEFLKHECEKVIGGYDFIGYDDDPFDELGHGTRVSGLIAGNGKYLKGVAPNAKLIVYRITDSNGYFAASNLLKAIEKMASEDVDVVSISLGIAPIGQGEDIAEAVNNLVDSGVVVVAAAGNSGPCGAGMCKEPDHPDGSSYSICSPGSAEKAITVGSVYKKDYLTSFRTDSSPKKDEVVCSSSRGPTPEGVNKPDIVAPGHFLCSSTPDIEEDIGAQCMDYEHGAFGGSSYATAVVSGAVALLKQAYPDWTPEQIKQVLKMSAVDLGENVNAQGAGRIDVFGAFKLGLDADHREYSTVSNPLTLKPIVHTSIVEPSPYSIFSLKEGKSLKIIGDVYENLKSMKVEYAPGFTLSEDADFKVLSTGSEEVRGQIAEIDPRELEDGILTLRLVAENAEGDKFYAIRPIISDAYMKAGWPQRIGLVSSSPLAYDLNNDTYKEIVALTHEGELYVFNPNGTLIEGWPVKIPTKFFMYSAPAAGDIDGDGYADIVISSGNGCIYALDYSGRYLKGFSPQDAYCTPAYVDNGVLIHPNTPLIADLDADGTNEVVVTHQRKFVVLNNDGSVMDGFPMDLLQGGGSMSDPVVVDADGDGDLEIFAGLSHYIHNNVLASYIGGWHHNGEPVENFPAEICLQRFPSGNCMFTQIVRISAGDVDNDSNIELVVNRGYDITKPPSVLIYNMSGVMETGPIYVPAPVEGPALFKKDDGTMGMVAITNTGMFLMDIRGGIEKFELGRSEDYYRYLPTSAPVLYDVNNDGKTEVIFGEIGGRLHVMETEKEAERIRVGRETQFNEYLKELIPPRETKHWAISPPLVDDIDMDKQLEVVAGYGTKQPALEGGIGVWELPYNITENREWTVHQHDSQRTGAYNLYLGKTKKPVANFYFTPQRPKFGDEIKFEAAGSEGDLSWDFDNDGETDATGNIVYHTFDDPGKYPVTLTVSVPGSNGERGENSENSKTKVIDVAPDISIEYTPEEIVAGKGVNFAVKFTPAIPEVDFGFGYFFSWDLDGDGVEDDTSRSPMFVYEEPGTYDVTLTAVKDYTTVVKTTVNVKENPLRNVLLGFYPSCENGYGAETYNVGLYLKEEIEDEIKEFRMRDQAECEYVNGIPAEFPMFDSASSSVVGLEKSPEKRILYKKGDELAKSLAEKLALKIAPSRSTRVGNPMHYESIETSEVGCPTSEGIYYHVICENPGSNVLIQYDFDDAEKIARDIAEAVKATVEIVSEQ